MSPTAEEAKERGSNAVRRLSAIEDTGERLIENPIDRLTPEQIKEIGRLFDELHEDVKNDLGERDATYIRSIIVVAIGLLRVRVAATARSRPRPRARSRRCGPSRLRSP